MTGIGLIGSEALCDKIPHVTLESGQPTLEPGHTTHCSSILAGFGALLNQIFLLSERGKASPVGVTVAQLRAQSCHALPGTAHRPQDS